jgi:hypothetical protein
VFLEGSLQRHQGREPYYTHASNLYKCLTSLSYIIAKNTAPVLHKICGHCTKYQLQTPKLEWHIEKWLITSRPITQ